MRQLLCLGVLIALLAACNGEDDKDDKDQTCDPADNPGCTLGECLFGPGPCADGVFECQDGEWVDIGHCDPASTEAG
ncbi:MAG TPA: hypothetical protein VNM90_27610 [Haliangium sp.]|nr:hypothetical protein [Haliangium sp.]